METQQASTKNLDIALGKAQIACKKVIKDGKNPHFKSSYPTLESVNESTADALKDNDLVFSSYPTESGLECRLVHVASGESRQWVSPYYLDKNTAQALGSCITYLRRYNKLSLLDLAPEDDDGNAASGLKEKAPKKEINPPVYEATPNQKKTLADVFSHLGVKDREIRTSINKALINWKVKSDRATIENTVKQCMEKIASGEELDFIPF